MPFGLSAAIAFVYGTIVGSFLNVCIWRMPRDESIVHPPSHCPNCDGKLRAWELAPLLSFLLLGRKCVRCKEPISWRYFGVELLTGVFFIAALWVTWYAPGFDVKSHGFRLEFFTFALFGSALIAAFFIDLEHWIIPDQLNVFCIALGIAHDLVAIGLAKLGHADLVLLKPIVFVPIPFTAISFPMLQSIIGIVVCGLIFYAIAVFGELAFKKEAMGGGDIKLAAAIGANLPLKFALLSFFLAVAIGSLVGVGWMLAMRIMRREFKSYVPFGPMMVTGAVTAIFFGSWMINAYWNYLGMPK